MRIPVLERDRFVVLYMASTSPADLFARLVFEDKNGDFGTFDPIHATSFTTDRTLNELTGQHFTRDGFITGGFLSGDFTGVKRGQFYAIMALQRGGRNDVLSRGYLYLGNPLAIGEFVEAGGGQGYMDWNQDANDQTGNAADLVINLGVTNARRVLRGILVKYHSDGNASTRTIIIRLRDVADTTGPTGFTIDEDVWESPTLTLTANEEGILYVTEHGFVSLNDAGTITYADNTTNPNPLPLWVEEGETADLVIDVGSGLAGDDMDVFTLIEEWIEI